MEQVSYSISNHEMFIGLVLLQKFRVHELFSTNDSNQSVFTLT